MKSARAWLFLSIYLLVTGFVGCVILSAAVTAYCAIGLGCSGQTIIGLYASTIGVAIPAALADASCHGSRVQVYCAC